MPESFIRKNPTTNCRAVRWADRADVVRARRVTVRVEPKAHAAERDFARPRP